MAGQHGKVIDLTAPAPALAPDTTDVSSIQMVTDRRQMRSVHHRERDMDVQIVSVSKFQPMKSSTPPKGTGSRKSKRKRRTKPRSDFSSSNEAMMMMTTLLYWETLQGTEM